MWKKAVLYNTTIDAFLRYGEKVLRKMKSVFQFFEQKNEFVLIWRPHPLLETTLQSMRPKLLDEYLKIVDYYKNKRIGILDESPDLHRAIAISDAYYGDWSSVVDLYKATGKPILIQDINILEKDVLQIKWAFYAYTFQIFQNKIYTTSPKGDALLCKGKNEKLSVIKHLLGGSTQALIFSASIIYKEKLIFAPWNADSFLCYDIVSTEVKEIPMEEPSKHEIFYLFQYGGDILAIGMNSMKVYRYDKTENLFRCILLGYGKKELSALKRVKIYAYIPFVDKKTNELCIYSINRNEWNVYPFRKGLIQDLLYDGEWCWIITKTGILAKLDASAGVCLEERKVSVDSNKIFLFDRGKKLLLLPEQGMVCMQVEKETLQLRNRILPVLGDELLHYFSEITDTQILVESYKKSMGWHLRMDESFWIYDYLENMVTWKALEDEDESCRMELMRLYAGGYWIGTRKRGKVLVENPSHGLNFLCCLLYATTEEQFETLPLCGKKIHDFMMGSA